MFKKNISYEKALKLLGKTIVTCQQRDGMSIGEIGTVVAIYNKSLFMPDFYSIIVKFEKCNNCTSLHPIGQYKDELSIYQNFNFDKEYMDYKFYVLYLDDIKELSNN